jgi:hypothetical protein
MEKCVSRPSLEVYVGAFLDEFLDFREVALFDGFEESLV